MGYHDAGEIPNYWTYAHDFVLQDHMYEPNASWSLPEHLYQVSEWSALCMDPNDPFSCSNALQSPNSPGQPLSQTPLYAWTDMTYLLHKYGVSWGYYVFKGTEPDCEQNAAMTCSPVRSRLRRLDLESAAAFRRRPAGRSARQCPDAQQFLHRGQERNAARGVVDRSQREGLRASHSAGQRRPDLRHRPDQRDHAQPRLEQHGDLPLLG